MGRNPHHKGAASHVSPKLCAKCIPNLKEGETTKTTRISFVTIDANISMFSNNVNAFQNVGVESEKR